MSKLLPLFGDRRLQMDDSIKLTVESLSLYGPRHDHWCVAWSGGKDSTALVTLLVHLIESGRVPRPKRLTVLYADTRMELLPLWISAAQIREQLQARGIEIRTVMAPLDKRFFVYMLGRGVPPPNNTTLRWCTRQIKIDPMVAELARIAVDKQVLMLTGVRQGESAIGGLLPANYTDGGQNQEQASKKRDSQDETPESLVSGQRRLATSGRNTYQVPIGT